MYDYNTYTDSIFYIIISVGIILFILALIWESKDYSRIKDMENVYDLPEDEKENKYIFYGSFYYNNGVIWRANYIRAFISTIIISYIICSSSSINRNVYILIFLAIFAVFYFAEIFEKFHYHRDICGKVNPHMKLI